MTPYVIVTTRKLVMKKASLLLLIIVSLLATSFAGIGAARASAAALTITPSSTTAGQTYVGLGLNFTPTYSVSYMNLYLQGYTLPTTPQAGYVSISGGTSSTVALVAGSASSLIVLFSTPLTAGYSYTLYFSPSFGLMNPTTAGSYTVQATLAGTGSQTLTGTVAIGSGLGAFTITPSTGASGSISPSTPQAVTYGANETFRMTPDPGYHISDVLVDGVSVGAVSRYTFSNVMANHTIRASFAIHK